MVGPMTSLNQGDFVPEIWMQDAFGRLRNELFLVQNVAKDSELTGEFTKGDVLNIPVRGLLTAQQKTETGDIVLQNPNTAKVTVTLDQHYHVAFSASSFLKATANQDFEMGYREDGIGVLAEQVEQSLLNLYASCTYSVGTAGSDIDESLVLDADERMNVNRAPKSGRFLAISAKDNKAMLKIDRFTSAEKIGRAGIIANGAIGRCQGFDVFNSNLIATSGAAPLSTHNMAWTRGGIVLASRPLPAIKGALSVQMVDPYSGLVFRVTMGYNSSKNEDQIVIDILWGVAIVRQEMVCRVLC